MKKKIAQINQSGLKGITDPLSYQRVLFINNLSLISAGVSFLFTIRIFLENLDPQLLITMGSGAVLFLSVIYFNRIRRYILARAYFFLTGVITIFVASYLAYSQGRFNETENVLIGFMVINYLLYDGKFRYIGFLLIYVVLIGLKFLKQDFLGGYDLDFYLTLQNISILCFLVFLFSEAFKNSLLKAFVRLRKKNELLYLMIDNAPLFIALIDKEMKYKMVNINYEKSFGEKREKIIGSHVSDVLPHNILEKHAPMIKRGLQGESLEFLELTEMPDGRSFYAGGKYVPVLSDNGDIVGVSVFVNDVTKLEEAKNKLAEANSIKNKMLSILCHDIRGTAGFI